MFKIGDIVKRRYSKKNYEVISTLSEDNNIMLISPYYKNKNITPVNDILVVEKSKFIKDLKFSRRLKLNRLKKIINNLL